MSMTIELSMSTKRRNSTMIVPSGTLKFRGELKENTSMHNPSILFDSFVSTAPPYNYMYIPEFRRYYFINDWTYELGLWCAHCSVDVLASWREEIITTPLYCLRTSWVSRWDEFIIDGMRPSRNVLTRNTCYFVNESKPFTSNIDGGNYVLGVIGKNSQNVGVVSYYVLTSSQLSSLMNSLFSTIDWLNLNSEEITNSLAKALVNPYQYIVSCTWFPFTVPTAGSVSSIDFGWWTMPVSASKLAKNSYFQAIGTATLSRHAQTDKYGMWLNSNPYTRVQVIFPPFGVISLDAMQVLVSNLQVQYKVVVDLISGVGTLYLYNGGEATKPLRVVGANIGVPIQIAQLSQNLIGAVTNAGGSLTSALTGNVIGVASGIVGAVGSLIPQLETSGYNGGFSAFIETPSIIEEFLEVTDLDFDDGRPCCSNIRLADNSEALGNYFLFSHGDITAIATHEELKEIKTLLESGIYYE